MKKFYSILTVISALALTACKSGAQNEALHNEEPDTVIVTSKHPILDSLLTEPDSSEIYNGSINITLANKDNIRFRMQNF